MNTCGGPRGPSSLGSSGAGNARCPSTALLSPGVFVAAAYEVLFKDGVIVLLGSKLCALFGCASLAASSIASSCSSAVGSLDDDLLLLIVVDVMAHVRAGLITHGSRAACGHVFS